MSFRVKCVKNLSFNRIKNKEHLINFYLEPTATRLIRLTSRPSPNRLVSCQAVSESLRCFLWPGTSAQLIRCAATKTKKKTSFAILLANSSCCCQPERERMIKCHNQFQFGARIELRQRAFYAWQAQENELAAKLIPCLAQPAWAAWAAWDAFAPEPEPAKEPTWLPLFLIKQNLRKSCL